MSLIDQLVWLAFSVVAKPRILVMFGLVPSSGCGGGLRIVLPCLQIKAESSC